MATVKKVKKVKRLVFKTVLIYDQCGQEALKFYVFDGDYRHLEGVFINSVESPQELQDELHDLLFDEEGQYVVKLKTKFPRKAVVGGAAVITAGFLP